MKETTQVKNPTFNQDESTEGKYFARISFGRVDETGSRLMKVTNENGFSWAIGENIFFEEMVGTDYDEDNVQKVSRTELARICMEELSQNMIFESGFVKSKGESRVLVGYKVGVKNYIGQLQVVDLEKKMEPGEDSGFRVIDLNRLNYIIFNGVKYECKTPVKSKQ